MYEYNQDKYIKIRNIIKIVFNTLQLRAILVHYCQTTSTFIISKTLIILIQLIWKLPNYIDPQYGDERMYEINIFFYCSPNKSNYDATL